MMTSQTPLRTDEFGRERVGVEATPTQALALATALPDHFFIIGSSLF